MFVRFIDYVDQEIDKRNWTRNELARRAGLGNSYFSLMAEKNRIPSAETCQKIAKALNIPVSVVLQWAGIIKKEGYSPITIMMADGIEELDNDDKATVLDLINSLKNRKGKKINLIDRELLCKDLEKLPTRYKIYVLVYIRYLHYRRHPRRAILLATILGGWIVHVINIVLLVLSDR